MTQLETLLQQGLYRQRHVIAAREGANIMLHQKSCINFCSSDYLGLATDPALKEAAIAAVEKYGVGSGASAMVSGYYDAHEAVEYAFAKFLKRDAAILFNSGFMANLGVMTALMSSQDIVAMDQLNHASLVDGLRLCGAKHLRYRHCDVSHLQRRIRSGLDYLVTESLFSMQGDVAPLVDLKNIAAQYNATFIVDEAHAIGVFGANGGGVLEQLNLTQEDVPLVICPLGKAFASQGAIVAGKRSLIERLLQFARTYRYSTALPPMLAATSLAALHLVKTQTWRRTQLQEKIALFRQVSKELSIPCLDSTSPIQSIMVGDNHRAMELSERLLEKDFFVKAIRPPSVPVNTARLRVTINVTHTEENIRDLLKAVAHEFL